MKRTTYLRTITPVILLSLLAAACGGGSSAEGEASPTRVTIYSAAPLQGAGRPIGEALVNGMQLAFEEAGFNAGGVEIDFVPLDDATAEAGAWTPEKALANAQRVVQDDTSIAYLATFNSGAAAIGIPLLNEVGLAMLSPGNTAVGLTSDDPGANVDDGEPEIYYPTGVRNYARIVPRDTIQGAALATIMGEDGCGRVGILHDQELYGVGLAANIEVAAQGLDFEIVVNEGIDPAATDLSTEAAALAAADVDCFVFSGITANGAVQLFEDVSAALPQAKLYGPDGVAESTFSDPANGGVSAEVGAKVQVTIPTLDPNHYPAAGQRFFSDYEARYGDANPNPFAIYGYEAAQLILDVLNRAGDPTDRESVRQALFDTTDRDSVLGAYSIDSNGDTTLTTYGVYRIEEGNLVFERSVRSG